MQRLGILRNRSLLTYPRDWTPRHASIRGTSVRVMLEAAIIRGKHKLRSGLIPGYL